jgi:predicted amidohydrolase YtcJ
VTSPHPTLTLHTVRRRRTRDAAIMGPSEALTLGEALHAITLAPARTAGPPDLETLRTGALADLVVVDADALAGTCPGPAVTDLTMTEGRIVWREGQDVADARGEG